MTLLPVSRVEALPLQGDHSTQEREGAALRRHRSPHKAARFVSQAAEVPWLALLVVDTQLLAGQLQRGQRGSPSVTHWGSFRAYQQPSSGCPVVDGVRCRLRCSDRTGDLTSLLECLDCRVGRRRRRRHGGTAGNYHRSRGVTDEKGWSPRDRSRTR